MMDPDPYPNPSDPVLAPGLFCPGAYVKTQTKIQVAQMSTDNKIL